VLAEEPILRVHRKVKALVASSMCLVIVKKILLDTNVLIDWLNSGRHESVMTDPGYARFLSAVVVMELRAGANTRASRDAVNAITRAYGTSGRLFPPSTDAFDRAGSVLRN